MKGSQSDSSREARLFSFLGEWPAGSVVVAQRLTVLGRYFDAPQRLRYQPGISDVTSIAREAGFRHIILKAPPSSPGLMADKDGTRPMKFAKPRHHKMGECA